MKKPECGADESIFLSSRVQRLSQDKMAWLKTLSSSWNGTLFFFFFLHIHTRKRVLAALSQSFRALSSRRFFSFFPLPLSLSLSPSLSLSRNKNEPDRMAGDAGDKDGQRWRSGEGERERETERGTVRSAYKATFSRWNNLKWRRVLAEKTVKRIFSPFQSFRSSTVFRGARTLTPTRFNQRVSFSKGEKRFDTDSIFVSSVSWRKFYTRITCITIVINYSYRWRILS